LSITWRWGLEGIIIGEITHSALSLLLYSHWSKKHINYAIKEQLTDIAPYLIASAAMGGSTYTLGILLEEVRSTILLGSQITFGGLLYFSICAILQPIAYKDALSQIQSYLHPKQTP
jgi:peptidoglycan biosynthesis protein MviN/MurJ (putative lipid II flippase)